MSYILDALKKTELEKNKQTRSDGRISISGDLFQERRQPAARAGRWKVVVLIAAASLATFTGTWLLLQGKDKKSVADIRLPASPTPAPVNSPAAMPVQVQSPTVFATPAMPPTKVTVPPNSMEAVDDVDDESSARAARRLKKRMNLQPPSPNQAAQAVQTPADIKLSGIAWQDERSARRAVVNGYLLKEGAVVSGARITAIHADKVRFSSSAGLFDIKLDAVLPPEVPR